MEECTKLIVKNKKIDSIIKFLKELISKKGFWIIVYFLIIYISNDFLNNEAYRNILLDGLTIEKRLYNIGYAGFNLIRFPKSICSIIIFILMYYIFLGITKKTRVSCFIPALVSQMFGIINYIVIDTRGLAIRMFDIYSFQTAMNVVNEISVNFNIFFWVSIILFIGANIFLFKFNIFKNENEPVKNRTRFFQIGIGMLGIIFFFICKPIISTVPIWNINFAYRASGPALTIIRSIIDAQKDFKPEDYNEKEVEEILSQYDDEENIDEKYPNILIVMNESFSDLSSLFNIKELEEVTPYYNKLLSEDNIVSGTMHVSAYGGGTGNVEYELLTQNTTAFLPSGAVPYQQYVTEELESAMPAILNKLNYTSYGIHPWLKTGYNRLNAYKYLQFNNQIFVEEMENLEYGENEYPTDSSTYEYYYEVMNNKPANERNLTFIVTMQNHIPYDDKIENGKQFVENDEALNIYMQLINKSDSALEELIGFLTEYEEDTIVLFFGDHQPNIGQKEKYGSKEKDIEEVNYIVPFFVWANFDIKEEKDIETSTNYLQSILFENAKLPLDEYTEYMTDLRKTIPVITANYYIAEDDNRYTIEDEESPYYEKVKEYSKVVYYQMFDN